MSGREERELDDAYQAGDHARARALASELLARVDAGEPAHTTARRVLAWTEPDPFLAIVGALGLGLTVWLVYNYIL